MKEILTKIYEIENEMEQVENQAEYWLQEEHLNIGKANLYESMADRLYDKVYELYNQVADFIVVLTSGQVDKITAMRMIRERRSDVERILALKI